MPILLCFFVRIPNLHLDFHPTFRPAYTFLEKNDILL